MFKVCSELPSACPPDSCCQTAAGLDWRVVAGAGCSSCSAQASSRLTRSETACGAQGPVAQELGFRGSGSRIWGLGQT